MRTDVSHGTNLCRGVDYCAGMDALGVLLRWKKERQHSGHSYSRIWNTDEDFLRQRAGAGHEDGGSQALFSGGKVGFFLSESQVADSGAVDWCETG